jgi:hypothetical protein
MRDIQTDHSPVAGEFSGYGESQITCSRAQVQDKLVSAFQDLLYSSISPRPIAAKTDNPIQDIVPSRDSVEHRLDPAIPWIVEGCRHRIKLEAACVKTVDRTVSWLKSRDR